MKISKVEIKPVGLKGDYEWFVSFTDIPGDRVNTKSKPYDGGFHYYPSRIGKRKAFEELKTHMINLHEKEIDSLTKSLEGLRALEIDTE